MQGQGENEAKADGKRKKKKKTKTNGEVKGMKSCDFQRVRTEYLCPC